MSNDEKYITNFPKNIQLSWQKLSQNLSKSIWEKNINNFRTYSNELYMLMLDMLIFAWDDEWLIYDLWYLWTWRFLYYPNEMELWIKDKLSKLEYIFIHELDLPINHTSFDSKEQLLSQVKNRLQDVINSL